jgi:hypothetical protein
VLILLDSIKKQARSDPVYRGSCLLARIIHYGVSLFGEFGEGVLKTKEK